MHDLISFASLSTKISDASSISIRFIVVGIVVAVAVTSTAKCLCSVLFFLYSVST